MKNKTNFNYLGTLFIMMITMITACNTNKGKENKLAEPAIDKKNMDTTVNPGANFFMFANGGWIKNNPVPEEYSRYGAFEVLQEKTYKDLKSILEDASKDDKADKNSNKRKIGDFYSSGMDSVKIDKEGAKPLDDEFKLIDAIKTKNDLQNEIVHLHTIGNYPFFMIYAAPDEKNSEMVIARLRQGGIGLPDRDYYLGKDARSKDIRDNYKIHIAKMFELLGDDKKKAEGSAENILKIETRLAEASWKRVDLRDPVKGYNKYKLDELQKKVPFISWKDYFSGIGISGIKEVNVGQPSFFEKLSDLMQEVSIDSWKTYLRWHLISSNASYLSSDFEKEHFNFYSKVLSGKTKMQPRWKRVLNTVDGGMGEAVGQVYVDKFFPPEAKKSMLELVMNLKESLKERIQTLTWMSKDTKVQALAKLEVMNVKIGYPDKWIDYSKLEISRESYVKNVMNSDKFEFAYLMNKVGKPVDKQEWHMSPQTINAYYNPNMNEIVFPAAILQPPFFNKDADVAINYGAIGAVIGHEMTHGFDDEGRQFDKNGNLKDWWTKEDAANFIKQTNVLIDQYNSFKILDSLHVDGKLTLGENIADFGGITVSLNALKKVWKTTGDTASIDGFTPLQRFFLSYGQVWRMTIRDKDQMRKLKEDVHAPGVARVNAVVRNVPELYEAFKIKPTDPLYYAPDKRAKIW
ncbi:MAG: M13 family metallopeptidase [Bacteroidales bacterium]|jgi:putative endopeptidase